eukprot:272995-Chlamydomonas_euryale.AAC.1
MNTCEGSGRVAAVKYATEWLLSHPSTKSQRPTAMTRDKARPRLGPARPRHGTQLALRAASDARKARIENATQPLVNCFPQLRRRTHLLDGVGDHRCAASAAADGRPHRRARRGATRNSMLHLGGHGGSRCEKIRRREARAKGCERTAEVVLNARQLAGSAVWVGAMESVGAGLTGASSLPSPAVL